MRSNSTTATNAAVTIRLILTASATRRARRSRRVAAQTKQTDTDDYLGPPVGRVRRVSDVFKPIDAFTYQETADAARPDGVEDRPIGLDPVGAKAEKRADRIAARPQNPMSAQSGLSPRESTRTPLLVQDDRG